MTRSEGKPPTWLDLFDPNYMDHCCEVIGAAIADVARGDKSLMHVPLRRHLVAELDSYEVEHWKPGSLQQHIEAARKLRELTTDLAERFEDRWPFDDDDAKHWADRLRLAWLEFIACGAGHRMYSDLPTELAAKQAAARRNRVAARAPRGQGKGVSVEDVAAYVKAHPDKQIKAIKIDLADCHNVSQATIARRLAAARKRNLIS